MDFIMLIKNMLIPPALHSVSAALLFLWLLFGKHLLIYSMHKQVSTSEMLNLRVYKIDPPKDQRDRERKSTWHSISNAVLFYLAIVFGLLNPTESTFLNSLNTFVVFYLWVEISYYFLHRAMHEFKPLYAVHREHHKSVIPTAHSTVAVSFFEEWIITALPWVVFISIASWFMEISLAGILAYFMFNFFISIGGHINTENSPVSLKMAKIGMGSPTSHALHHTRFKVNYGFSSVLLDRWLGTYSDETDDLCRRALAGDGNMDLKRPTNKMGVAGDILVSKLPTTGN